MIQECIGENLRWNSV